MVTGGRECVHHWGIFKSTCLLREDPRCCAMTTGQDIVSVRLAHDNALKQIAEILQ